MKKSNGSWDEAHKVKSPRRLISTTKSDKALSRWAGTLNLSNLFWTMGGAWPMENVYLIGFCLLGAQGGNHIHNIHGSFFSSAFSCVVHTFRAALVCGDCRFIAR